MDKVVEFLSGEFFLRGRPNGGTAVLLRSLWVAALICLLVLPAKSYFAKDAVFAFSAAQLRIEIGEIIPWFGAVFAGAYAALYSRFAAQWSYLASLYNQLMAACVSLPPEQRQGNKVLANWRAAFVEDAIDLHLAQKSTFRSAIIGLLQNGEVVRAFLDSTERALVRLQTLETELEFTAASPSHSEARSCVELAKAQSN